MANKVFNAGDKVWHPKTALFGSVITAGSETVPDGHARVSVYDPTCAEGFTFFVWSFDSLELLDEEEFNVVKNLVKWKQEKTRLNKLVEEAKKEYGVAHEAMLEFLMRMAQHGTRRYAGIGQVTIDGKDIHTSISEENKEEAFKEIEAMGRGEIIKRTVHPSTLESFVSELQDAGIAVPKHISVFETPKLSFAKKK